MNKTFSTIFCAVLFSLLVIATAQASLTITGNPSSLSVYQDNSEDSYFILNSTIDTTVTLSASGLPSDTTLSFSSTSVHLNANESQRVNFTVNAGNDADLGKKTVTINATSLSGNASFAFILTVKRNFCEYGELGNDIKIDVDEPGTNDDFYAGDTISVELNVDTNDEINFDISVELYDVTTGEVIEEASLEDIDLDDEDNDYALEIKVPYDVDTGDDYVIDVKTEGENSDDDEQCQQESIPVELKKRNHALVIDKVTYSSTLSCSMPLDLSIKVANAGKHDESDVEVSISSTALNISSTLTKDIDENDKETFIFTDVLPTVAPGKYTLEIEARGDDASDYQSIELNLQANCRVQKQDASMVILQQNTASVNQDVIFKTTITNTGDKATTYNINVLNYQSWATLSGVSPAQVTLNAGESKDVIITLRPTQNASSSNSFKVQASFGNQTKTQDAVLTISSQNQNPPITGGSIGTAIKNNLWLFIINVILVIIIIGLIILIAAKPRKKAVVREEPKEARLKAKNGKKK